ncbi:isochorismatase family protein [Nocardioides sp.]|uniref:isochorismatase family protein n=1 Tax=Nocardioides sp. TaxID=35761 RepID=UPI002C35A2F7|nr:isochorismatase family protein [Nocardioides sp.]HXH79710.1 isochorismatase family protein [Nocardioides sp.]
MSSPRRALVVVDVQQEYFDGPLQVQHPPREESLTNIIEALDIATEHGLPVVVVQHEQPEGSPVFAAGSAGWALHPEIEKRLQPSWKSITKDKSSVFAGTGVADWLKGQGVDTITLVGHMTNNCDIASAVEAEGLGLAAEVLSDATGAIHLANEMGKVRAEVLHEVLLVLLQSNFAAVGSTEAWADAVRSGQALPKSNLVTSAMQGRAAFAG